MENVLVTILVMGAAVSIVRKGIPGLLTWQGYSHQDRGEYEAAEQYFLKALSFEKAIQKITGQKIGVALQYTNLGFLYHHQKRLEDAVTMFKGAIDIYTGLGRSDDYSAPVYGDLGKIYFDSGDLHLAEENLRKALTIYSRRPNAQEAIDTTTALLDLIEGMRLNQKGIWLGKQGRNDEAETIFREAIKIAPLLPLPKINLCNVLNEQGRFDEAEALLKEVLRLPFYDKEREDALYILGNCYYYRTKFKNAIASYKSAQQVRNTSSADIHYMLGLCYEKLGEWDKAREELDRAGSSDDYPLVPAKQKDDIYRAITRIESCARQSEIIDEILSEFSPTSFSLSYCSSENLDQEIATNLSYIIDLRKSNVFFVGAGISYPAPSNLPLASYIMREIFRILFELDRHDICQIYKLPMDIGYRGAYKHIASHLTKSENLPFEASFKALRETVGFPVVRFVDTLLTGSPNLNHLMLAHAIKRGHLVVTVNFDEHIENAYKILFPNDTLKVVIEDSDFQKDIDDGQILEGKLVKIHGTASDYNSVALMLNDVVRATDGILHYGISIREALREQASLIYPRTTLSVPKAFFLQKALQSTQTIFMGYSDSDMFDIHPVLHSREFGWQGLWVHHSTEKEVLEDADPEKFHLYADTSKLTCYVTRSFGLSCNIALIDGSYALQWSEAFKDWVNYLRLKEGDGLNWIGKLYSQRGEWEQAETFYEKAANKYEDQFVDKWLSTKINLAFAKDATLSKADNSLLSQIRLYVEENNLQDQFKSGYATVLLNTAAGLLASKTTEPIEEIEYLVWKGLEYAQKGRAFEVVAHAYELLGDIFVCKENFKKALDSYWEAYLISSTVTGDVISMISILTSAAKCASNINQEDAAGTMLDQAMMLARKFGNKSLIAAVVMARERDLKWRSTLQLELREKVIKEAESFKSDIEEFDQIYIELLGNPSTENWEQMEKELNELLERYPEASAQSYLHFLKSSISISNLHRELHNKAIREAPESFKDEIEDLYLNLRPATYDLVIQRIDKVLQEYPQPSVLSLLLFLKSNIYRRKDDRKQEIRVLNQFIRMQPDNPLAEHNLGAAYSSLRDYDLGERHLLKAIELMEGQYPLAIYNLALLYAEFGEFGKAKYQKEKLEQMGVPKSWVMEIDKRIG